MMLPNFCLCLYCSDRNFVNVFSSNEGGLAPMRVALRGDWGGMVVLNINNNQDYSNTKALSH